MINISKLTKVDPNDSNLKMIIPKNKGIYFWYDIATDKIVCIGTSSGVKGLYNRIIGQHLNPKYIEYRAKVHNQEKDVFQLQHPIIRDRDNAPGIDQSAFRKNVGRTFKVKPGIGTVNFIKEHFYLRYLEMENKEELINLEKQLIQIRQPKLNISHKYKISNKPF